MRLKVLVLGLALVVGGWYGARRARSALFGSGGLFAGKAASAALPVEPIASRSPIPKRPSVAVVGRAGDVVMLDGGVFLSVGDRYEGWFVVQVDDGGVLLVNGRERLRIPWRSAGIGTSTVLGRTGPTRRKARARRSDDAGGASSDAAPCVSCTS